MNDKVASNKNFNLFGSQKNLKQDARVSSDNKGLASKDLIQLVGVVRSIDPQLTLSIDDRKRLSDSLLDIEGIARSDTNSSKLKGKLFSIRDIISNASGSIIASSVVAMINELSKAL